MRKDKGRGAPHTSPQSKVVDPHDKPGKDVQGRGMPRGWTMQATVGRSRRKAESLAHGMQLLQEKERVRMQSPPIRAKVVCLTTPQFH